MEDIAYFYSLNKITFAVTRQNKEYIIDFPLDKLMEQLDPDKFFRTNRQTIINIESIVKIEPYFQNKVIVHIKPEHKEKYWSAKKMGLFQAMVELLDLSPIAIIPFFSIVPILLILFRFGLIRFRWFPIVMTMVVTIPMSI